MDTKFFDRLINYNFAKLRKDVFIAVPDLYGFQEWDDGKDQRWQAIKKADAISQAEIDLIQAAIDSHDPIDHVEQREITAESKAAAVPGWATWTEAEALAWVAANVEPELTSVAPKTLQMISSMARLIIVLRDRAMPGLRGQQSDD